MNRQLKIFVAAIAASVSSFTTAAQTIDSIALLQNARSAGVGKLCLFLHSSDPSQRSRAAVALANTEDSSSAQDLLAALNDPEPSVRRSAAFALGQFGKSEAARDLLARLRVEVDQACIREDVDAIGKCGTQDDLISLARLAPSFLPGIESSAALSVARFALRRVKDSSATAYVAGLLSHPEAAQLAAYALMRIGDSLWARGHLPALLSAMEDPSPNSRMWTASLLGLTGDSAAAAAVRNHAAGDPDWRVRVNCVRALRGQTAGAATPVLLSLTADSNEHVALTAFSVLNSDHERYSSESVVERLRSEMEDSLHFSWRRRGDAASFIANAEKDKSIPQLIRLLNNSPLFRAEIISSLGETNSLGAIPFLQNELLESDSRTAGAAVEAYQRVVSDKDSTVQTEFCSRIVPLLHRHDISISFAVAAAMEDSSIPVQIRLMYAPDLIEAYRTMSTPDDLEVMMEFIELFGEMKLGSAVPLLQESLRDKSPIVGRAAAASLRAITGKNYDGGIRSAPDTGKEYDQEDIALFSRIHSASMVTSKGVIIIKFRPDAAPFTVLNFISLVRKHFYDGLIFHRVVPNFVIQGGDPLGTGFGGPGYPIRTEVSPDAVYSEGAVGMASSGKDTEGSQFFVTHCAAPHLDGRYTIFGYTREMDVVDAIQRGDTIISVRLAE